MKKEVTLATLSIIFSGTAHSTQNERPDIIVIIADDMGYSDITPFGGEIPTPNLQAMAENGVRMSQYYTSPMSAPARAMLLTGNTSQQAGIGGMWWYENTIGKEGYELRLTDRVTTMAERFKDAGYNTLMAGKWHLGFTPGSTPKDRGFRHSFALMGGGASHFDDAVPLGTVRYFIPIIPVTISAFHCPLVFTPAKPMPARLIAGSARRHGNNLSSRGWPLLRHMILCRRRMNGLVVLNVSMNRAMQTSIVSVLLV